MNIFEEIKKLDLPEDEFVVLGSGILGALGIREIKDVDLLMTPELFEKLKERGWKYDTIEIEGRQRDRISFGLTEAYKDFWWSGKEIWPKDEIAKAKIINGVRFRSLEDMLSMKKEMGREKDLRDVVLIEEYLKSHPEYLNNISKAMQKVFPRSTIVSIEKFTRGLTSSVYKVVISNPNKILAVKFFLAEIEARVVKSVQISNYLGENGIPSPHIYDIVTGNDRWLVMDCLPGVTVHEVWDNETQKNQLTIIKNMGAMLKRIHGLKAPSFWTHYKHEIATQAEWVEWTKLRIKKYLNIAEEKLDGTQVNFLRLKFSRLEELYEAHPDFRFVPMHWDFHLANVNIDNNNEICGVFDFDNIMKGHDMADLGQTIYWLLFQKKLSDLEVEELFSGYGDLSELDKEFAKLHALLFLVGVMRSRWSKENDDKEWINERHTEILKRCARGECLFSENNKSQQQ